MLHNIILIRNTVKISKIKESFSIHKRYTARSNVKQSYHNRKVNNHIQHRR